MLFGDGQWLSWCQEATLPGEVWAEQGRFSSNGRKKSYSCIGTNGTILKNHCTRRVSWTLMYLRCDDLEGGWRRWTGTRLPHSGIPWAFHSLAGKEPQGCGGLKPAAIPWTFRAQIWILLSKSGLHRAVCWYGPPIMNTGDGSRKRSNPLLVF